MGQFYFTAPLKHATFRSQPQGAADITMFWRQSSKYWFEKNPAFDAFFRDRFAQLHIEVASGSHDNWLADPYGALALLLLTDQYPRNAFRGTGDMYCTDAHAIQYARIALKAGYPDQVEARLKLFFFLPFAHSEELDDQRISVTYTESLGQPWSSRARHYMEIIGRFGRFPHRNEMLGRASTIEEVAFLQTGGTLS